MSLRLRDCPRADRWERRGLANGVVPRNRASAWRWICWLAVGLATLLGIGCQRSAAPQPERDHEKKPTVARPADSKPVEKPAPLVTVTVAYGSEKRAWLDEQIAAFNANAPRTATGAKISIEGKAMGSGEATQDLAEERLPVTVFSPASGAYITLLNDAWLSRSNHTKPIAPSSESLVISPVVIALWKPMAEVLGWPKKQLGWSDIIEQTRDARGFAARGRPEWGRFKLGHTHPEYSSSGLLAMLAEAYAGAKKTRGLSLSDLADKKVRDFLSGVESAIEHYGKSTGFFADKMIERGPSYLSAAVLYENLVIESYAKPMPHGMSVVSIYPREGTFWADHPFAILDAPWVNAEQREGASLFLQFLKTRPAQERALALGFRPGDTSVPVAAPIDAEHGCDAKQPQTLLDVPDATVLRKLVEVFGEVKKPSDVLLVFDKSGSMNGNPLKEAKLGAQAFLESLHDRDQVGILFFDSKVYPTVGPLAVAAYRKDMAARVNDVIASGGTALYDAIAAGYASMKQRGESDKGRIHAMVVMTDGKDESSKLGLDELKATFPGSEQETPTKLFTIAYGNAVEEKVLAGIADAGKGSHTKGTVSNIVQVYRDVASFF